MTEIKNEKMVYQGPVTVRFDGLYGNFATITINSERTRATINNKYTQPHVYFVGEVYASVTILDHKGNQCYNQAFIGDSFYQPNEVSVTIGEGYKFIFHHREPSREFIVDNCGNAVPQKCLDTVFIIENNELVKITDELIFLGYNDWNFAKAMIDVTNQKVNIQINAGKPHPSFGKTLYAFITVKNEQHQSIYSKMFYGDDYNAADIVSLDFKEGYKLLTYHTEPSHRLILHDRHGHTFNLFRKFNHFLLSGSNLIQTNEGFDFFGLENYNFANISIDHSEGIMKVQIEEGQPNIHFGNVEYAKINVMDNQNRSVYSEIFRGNTQNKAREDTIDLKENYTLTIEHMEPYRLKIYMDDNLITTQNVCNKYIVKNQKLVAIPS